MTNDEREKMWGLFRMQLMAALHRVVADVYQNAKSIEETNMAINECFNYHMHFIIGRPEWFKDAHNHMWQKDSDRILATNLSDFDGRVSENLRNSPEEKIKSPQAN